MTVIPEDLDAIEQADELELENPPLDKPKDSQLPETRVPLFAYIPVNETEIRDLVTKIWKLAEKIYEVAVTPKLIGKVYSPRTLQLVVDTATATIIQNIIELEYPSLNERLKEHLKNLFDKFENKDPDTYQSLIDSGFYLAIRETTLKQLKKEF